MIKKITVLALLLIPFFFSFSEVKKEGSLNEPSNLMYADTTIILPNIDFEFIERKTSKAKKDVEVYSQFCSKKNRMDKEFISKYLSSQKIAIGDSELLDLNNYDGFCFKEYKEFPAFNLFTFTYENGTCCKTLYGVTTKKGSLEIINLGELAFTGDKDGWLGDKYGKWISEDIMDMITISYYDDDFVETNNNSRVDTTWSIIRIDKKGLFKENAYKRVKYLEGRKIE
ncbi:hypothetical protein [Polaribacter sp. Q13]|uniref:hypothetical protein n=1 Tax=Polaribacter sp. Q13 TaxID=2806551 RepID=UPI00193C7386|nr:hypothetical protein [Polaribacter sp. Q13]QVY66021.1 hypothetical protein JOP69_01625 [Polaribacter sp. Q13]